MSPVENKVSENESIERRKRHPGYKFYSKNSKERLYKVEAVSINQRPGTRKINEKKPMVKSQ